MKKNHLTPLLKIKSFYSLALLAAVISLFVVSCNKFSEDFDFNKVVVPDWNPEFAIPMVNSTFVLADFFGDSGIQYIKTNPDNSLSLVYTSTEMFSQRVEDFVNIPTQSFNYQSPFIVPPLPQGTSFEVSLEFPIQLMAGSPDQRLDSLILKNGSLHIAGQTNLNRDVTELTVKIPEIIHKTTGEPLIMLISLNNPNQQSNVTYDLNVPIGDYKFIFDNIGASTKNQITIQCSLRIEGDDNPDLSPYNFSINGSFSNLDFKFLFGYLGTYNVSLSDSLSISLFDKTIGGGIEIGQDAVDLFVEIKNPIGMTIAFGTEYFYATSKVNTPNKVDINFIGTGNQNSFQVDGPDITQVGEIIETHLDFGDNNFSEAFNIAPENLYYKFVGESNPDGDSLASNFVTDTSRISMTVGIELKLFTAIKEFKIQDTLDFTLNDVQQIENLLVRINATNGFPLNANVQLYFVNSNFTVLDSLITDPNLTILPGAPVSGAPDYRVTEPAHKMTDIILTSERIHLILDAKKMIVRAGLSTTNEQLIKIYSDYSLQIQIGTIAGIKIKTN